MKAPESNVSSFGTYLQTVRRHKKGVQQAVVSPQTATDLLTHLSEGAPKTFDALRDETGLSTLRLAKSIEIMEEAGLVDIAPSEEGTDDLVKLTEHGAKVARLGTDWDGD